MTLPVVIIGAGQAGVRAAEALRALGREEPIVMFGNEPCAPYQRPPLSKTFLAGEIAEERLYLQGEHFFERHGVELHTRRAVLAIEPAERRIIVQGSSAPVAYGKLLIATGCRPRPLPVPGADDVELLTLRSIADVALLRERLETAESPVIDRRRLYRA
ncbi:MAG: FAD-dependent oxidoreductase [Rhodomicrobium sp.]|nr:FAD-dependent oxidoreductase [Rhodomicrobium sp.]